MDHADFTDKLFSNAGPSAFYLYKEYDIYFEINNYQGM